MTVPTAQLAARRSTTHHCWKCNYPLPAPGEQTCPECGHRGHTVPGASPGRPSRRFTLGAALMVAAVAGLPLLAAAVSALLRL